MACHRAADPGQRNAAPGVSEQEPRRQRLGRLPARRGRRGLGSNRPPRPLARTGLEPRRVRTADLRAGTQPVQLGQSRDADPVPDSGLVRAEQGRRVPAADVGQRPLEHVSPVARRSGDPGAQRAAVAGGLRRGAGGARRAPRQNETLHLHPLAVHHERAQRQLVLVAGAAEPADAAQARPGRRARRWTSGGSRCRCPART